MHRLRLRPLHAGDESEFVRGHEAMAAEDFTFGLDYEPTDAWSNFLDRLDRNRRGIGIPDGRVASTFLVGDVGGGLVGRASIRHELNDFLAREGGHIGYGVLAAHRSRGYATEILRQSLVIARAVGVTDALLTCDEDDAASAAVIERRGGVFESYVLAARSNLAGLASGRGFCRSGAGTADTSRAQTALPAPGTAGKPSVHLGQLAR